jgi:RNA polymerase sigma factor (sigma-70 family)
MRWTPTPQSADIRRARLTLTIICARRIIDLVAKFRIDKIAELCRQLSFTPQEARSQQLTAAEELLLEIDPAKAYPLNFLVFRITGYHPRQVDQALLTGLAVQHDLGLLIEQASQTLNLRVDTAGQPVLGIDDVAQRFNVTSKTIQRWRRRGLAARRFVFPDGKKRMGFLADTVERFLAIHRDQVAPITNFSEVSQSEAAHILRRAARLAIHCRCCASEICRRIARRTNRSPLTIAQIIKTHDQHHPRCAIFPAAPAELGQDDRVEILRAFRCGAALADLARRMDRRRYTIYRAIIEERLAQLNRRRVRFIDDPLYHQNDASAVVDQIVAQQELPADRNADELRIPRDLPPYLADLYRTPLLSPARERALFLKLNFHKFQFVTARRRIEPQLARAGDLSLLEACRRDVIDARNKIVRANLRLVVSVARKHLRPGLSLMELISDGNLTLMRAVESFDFHRGYRFSTYATLALMKGFARSVCQMQSSGRQAIHNPLLLAAVADGDGPNAVHRMLCRDEVSRLLSQLEQRERDVIRAHYGLNEGCPATYEQVGSRMGLSKQRVRQIEQLALAKLRAAQSG